MVMAPTVRTQSSSFTQNPPNESDKDIWSSILQQTQHSSTNKLPSDKSILILGDNDSGKTSLIARMQGSNNTSKGSGLEYQYIIVRDEYRDEQTQCGIFILDGNYNRKEGLLIWALNKDTFKDSTVVLMCSMTKPWNIINSLNYWAKILEEHIKNIKLDPSELKKYRLNQQHRFQDYISPGDDIEGLTLHRNRTNSADDFDLKQRDPLPEGVLDVNLGLDIVVVITKTDYMSNLEKEYDYKEEHFDFIQQAIRRFCLKYGASLMYVSAKINKNCDLLYKYLIHRIYGLKFDTPALVVEKDAVFIPSGWDSDKKISILYENIQSFSPEDKYNDIITIPPSVNIFKTQEPEIVPEDDQIFLIKLKTQLNQQTPVLSTPTKNTTPTMQKSIGISGTPVQLDQSKGSPGEGVLQSFFNSLLSRKSTGSTSVGGGSSRISNPLSSQSASASQAASDSLKTRDVNAELNRILEDNNKSLNNSQD